MMGLVPLHYEVSTWAMRQGVNYKARADQYTFGFEVRRRRKRVPKTGSDVLIQTYIDRRAPCS